MAFFELKRGRTRNVILVGSLAFKIPTFSDYTHFLTGLLGNHHEYHHQYIYPDLQAPVWFYLTGGFLVVMPRCQTLDITDDNDLSKLTQYMNRLYDEDPDPQSRASKLMDIVEFEPENLGWFQGRLVSVDYGHGRQRSLNQWIIENQRSTPASHRRKA